MSILYYIESIRYWILKRW